MRAKILFYLSFIFYINVVSCFTVIIITQTTLYSTKFDQSRFKHKTCINVALYSLEDCLMIIVLLDEKSSNIDINSKT